MIVELISQIELAEEQAEKLHKDTRKKIQELEQAHQKKIENLRTQSEEETTKKIKEFRSDAGKSDKGEKSTTDVTVPKAKTEAAVKHIIKEFKTRYLP
ncbi:MAG: hypothetical protein FWE16_05140 [Firmicutes bacterium]|nr:hypothetical protein [Bacillota bacterium]